MDGIEKQVRFLTDEDLVALSAASAEAEMRSFTLEDARQVPLTGGVFAELELEARGLFPMERLKDKYSRSGTHLVLVLADSGILQPVEKGSGATVVAGRPSMLTIWQNYPVGTSSVWVGTPVGAQHLEYRQRFWYPVLPSRLASRFGVILINGAGERKEGSCQVAGFQGT